MMPSGEAKWPVDSRGMVYLSGVNKSSLCREIQANSTYRAGMDTMHHEPTEFPEPIGPDWTLEGQGPLWRR